MRIERILLSVVLSSLVVSSARAETRSDIEATVAREKFEASAFDPSLESPAAVPIVEGWKSQVKLESTTSGNVSAGAKLAGVFTLGGQDISVDLKLNGPIDKTSGGAKLASLDGLANSVNGDFGASMIIWHPRFREGSRAQLNDICFQNICSQQKKLVYCASRAPEEQIKINEKLKSLAVDAELAKLENKPDRVREIKKEAETLSRKQGDDCATLIADAPDKLDAFSCEKYLWHASWNPGSDPQGLTGRSAAALTGRFECSAGSLEPASRVRYLEALEEPTPPILLSARAKIGGESFDFVDADTLMKQSSSEVNYALTASAGILLEPLGFLAFNYRHEEAYKANPKTSLCQPLPGFPGTTTCNDVSIGPPKLQHHEILQLELRKFFSAKFAVNPKVNYDASDNVTAVEAPVYFLWNKDNGLNGGVNVGWRSDTDEVTATLFVGAALTLFGLP